VTKTYMRLLGWRPWKAVSDSISRSSQQRLMRVRPSVLERSSGLLCDYFCWASSRFEEDQRRGVNRKGQERKSYVHRRGPLRGLKSQKREADWRWRSTSSTPPEQTRPSSSHQGKGWPVVQDRNGTNSGIFVFLFRVFGSFVLHDSKQAAGLAFCL
jgi:hypothetical protein